MKTIVEFELEGSERAAGRFLRPKLPWEHCTTAEELYIAIRRGGVKPDAWLRCDTVGFEKWPERLIQLRHVVSIQLHKVPDPPCSSRFEFGWMCERDGGHPGPHLVTSGGARVWFNDNGQRVEGASAEDYA